MTERINFLGDWHYPTLVSMRQDYKEDLRESNRMRRPFQMWKMKCVKCGDEYESLPVPKCCINKLECPKCRGE